MAKILRFLICFILVGSTSKISNCTDESVKTSSSSDAIETPSTNSIVYDVEQIVNGEIDVPRYDPNVKEVPARQKEVEVKSYIKVKALIADFLDSCIKNKNSVTAYPRLLAYGPRFLSTSIKSYRKHKAVQPKLAWPTEFYLLLTGIMREALRMGSIEGKKMKATKQQVVTTELKKQFEELADMGQRMLEMSPVGGYIDVNSLVYKGKTIVEYNADIIAHLEAIGYGFLIKSSLSLISKLESIVKGDSIFG